MEKRKIFRGLLALLCAGTSIFANYEKRVEGLERQARETITHPMGENEEPKNFGRVGYIKSLPGSPKEIGILKRGEVYDILKIEDGKSTTAEDLCEKLKEGDTISYDHIPVEGSIRLADLKILEPSYPGEILPPKGDANSIIGKIISGKSQKPSFTIDTSEGSYKIILNNLSQKRGENYLKLGTLVQVPREPFRRKTLSADNVTLLRRRKF